MLAIISTGKKIKPSRESGVPEWYVQVSVSWLVQTFQWKPHLSKDQRPRACDTQTCRKKTSLWRSKIQFNSWEFNHTVSQMRIRVASHRKDIRKATGNHCEELCWPLLPDWPWGWQWEGKHLMCCHYESDSSIFLPLSGNFVINWDSP